MSKSGRKKKAAPPTSANNRPLTSKPPPYEAPSNAPTRSAAPLSPMIRSTDQPAGLPARSSSVASLASASEGESRLAMARIWVKMGTRSRSLEPSSFRTTPRWSTVPSMSSNDFATPVGSPEPPPIASTAHNKPTETRPVPRYRTNTSHLDLHDVTHPDDSDEQHDDASDSHEDPNPVRPQQRDVLIVD